MTGVGIRAIQEWPGHNSLAMTVRYSHLSPDFQQEAVDTLVQPQPEAHAEKRTDTEQEVSAESPTTSVHQLSALQ